MYAHRIWERVGAAKKCGHARSLNVGNMAARVQGVSAFWAQRLDGLGAKPCDTFRIEQLALM
jgi:hypothetical protein